LSLPSNLGKLEQAYLVFTQAAKIMEENKVYQIVAITVIILEKDFRQLRDSFIQGDTGLILISLLPKDLQMLMISVWKQGIEDLG